MIHVKLCKTFHLKFCCINFFLLSAKFYTLFDFALPRSYILLLVAIALDHVLNPIDPCLTLKINEERA